MKNCATWKPILHDYLEGLLEPEEAERAREHLLACPDCQQRVAEWEQVQRLLSELPQLPALARAGAIRPVVTPLFQPAQVAALWAGLAVPSAWLLQKFASLFNWQTALTWSWLPSFVTLSRWVEDLIQWLGRIVG